jgi:hypothetical protein
MDETAGILALSLAFVGLGMCVLLRATGLLPVSGTTVLFTLACMASLTGLVVGSYWLCGESPSRQLPGSILSAGGCIGLSICAGSLVGRRGQPQ